MSAAPSAASSRAGAAVWVAGGALIVDAATDLPAVGAFYGLLNATAVTSAVCAGALLLAAAAALRSGPRPRPGALRSGPDPEAAALRSGRDSRARAAALPTETSPASPSAPGRLVRLLPLPALVLTLWWSRTHVEAFTRLPWTVAAAGAALSLLGAALLRAPALAVAGLCAVWGVAVRVSHFDRFSLTFGADMLPLVRAALRSLLAGRSPYAFYDLPTPLPLTYHPLTWLGYLPAQVAMLDLRFTNLALAFAVPAAALYVRGTSLRCLDTAPARALCAWGALFLLPSSVYFDRITAAPVAWATLAFALAAAARSRPRAPVALGLCAAATPLAAVVTPLLFVLWAHEAGARRALGRVLAAAALAAALALPFFLWAPRAFVDGVVLWFNDLSGFPAHKWTTLGTWARYPGFAGAFWTAGLQAWLRPLQVALVAAVTALFAWRLRRGSAGAADLPAHAAAAFVAFMAFNPVIWPYFYQPALVCGLLALSAGGAAGTPTSTSVTPPAARRAGAAPA